MDESQMLQYEYLLRQVLETLERIPADRAVYELDEQGAEDATLTLGGVLDDLEAVERMMST